MTLNILALDQTTIFFIIIGGIVLFVLIWALLAGIRSRRKEKAAQKSLENVKPSVQANEATANEVIPTEDANAEEVKDESKEEKQEVTDDPRKYTVVISASGMKKVSNDEIKKQGVAEEEANEDAVEEVTEETSTEEAVEAAVE